MLKVTLFTNNFVVIETLLSEVLLRDDVIAVKDKVNGKVKVEKPGEDDLRIAKEIYDLVREMVQRHSHQ